MVEALERMGLMKYFQVVYYILLELMYTMWSAINMCMLLTVMLLMQAIVTEEDGMESIAHRFLSAAVKVRLKCIWALDWCISNTYKNTNITLRLLFFGEGRISRSVVCELKMLNFLF